MVDEDRIEEEELTPDDVADALYVTPDELDDEAHMIPEWDDPDENGPPGKDAWIADRPNGPKVLCWETEDGFTVELWNEQPTDWRATIGLPNEVDQLWYQTWKIKAHHPVVTGDTPCGFVENVEWLNDEGGTVDQITLRISCNFQPVFEVENYIDKLREHHQGTIEDMERRERLMEKARENVEEPPEIGFNEAGDPDGYMDDSEE